MTRMVGFYGSGIRWATVSLAGLLLVGVSTVEAQDSGAPPWGEFLRQFKRDPLLKEAFHKLDDKDPKGLSSKIRARELDVPNRIKAIGYLSELDCRQFPEARAVLLEQLNPEKERWPEVRLAAAAGLRDMLSRGAKPAGSSQKKGRSGYASLSYGPGCCDAETLQVLARSAYEMKPNGGCYEPSLEVRKMAVEAIKVCGIPCHYSPYVATPEVGPQPIEEGGEQKASEPVPPPKAEEPAVKPSPADATSVIPRLSDICIVSLKAGDYRRADPTIRSEYRGRIYHFSTVEARSQFDAAPEKFAVAFGGCDPVAYVQSGSIEDGRFLITYAGRFYMFSSAENAAKFRRSPENFLPENDSNSRVVAR